jgi:hypothetical protein
VATPPGGGKQLLSRSVLGGRTVCRGGGDTVVAPAVYFRAEHLGSRATPAIVSKVPRDRMHMVTVACKTAYFLFRGCFEATKAPRQSDRRDPILGGDVGVGASTEAGLVGQSLSVRRWPKHHFAEDQRSRRETDGSVGVSNR